MSVIKRREWGPFLFGSAECVWGAVGVARNHRHMRRRAESQAGDEKPQGGHFPGDP